MPTERLPENKNTSTAKPAPIKPSAPNRSNGAAGPRVAVKRPPVSGRASSPPSAGKQPTNGGRVYPMNNAAPQRAASPKSPAGTGKEMPKQRPANEAKKAPAAKMPTKEKPPKAPRGPLITAEGVSQFLFVVMVSLIIYAVLCGIAYGIFYGIHHFHWSWNYDITVKLDDSSNKPSTYSTSKNAVFRGEDNEPYIAVSRLANSLGLSAVGDADSIRFYKTGDVNGYAVFTDQSKEVNVNGVVIRLCSPVYIVGGIAYVPISFFNCYTSGITISYDTDERMMTVLYTVDEALSTPKRKVLKEFTFCVTSPEALDELTEKEWFEYVGNQS